MELRPFREMNIGDKYVTKSRVVTATDLDLYSVIAGVTEALHFSDEYCQSIGFKARLVPGPLILGIANGLFVQSGSNEGVVAFLGMDKFRLTSPVHPYNAIRLEGEIIRKRDTSKGDRVIITHAWAVKNQDDVTVAQGENTVMYNKPTST